MPQATPTVPKNSPAPPMRLNDKQRVVVDELSRNILLLAPAGTGKTNTLSARIAGIIEHGRAQPHEILCLTFTNRACREMLERIEAVAGPASLGVTVRTVHSFAYHMLLDYGDLLGDRPENMGICDEEDSLELIRDLLAERALVPDEQLARAARLFAGFFELVKHQMYRMRNPSVAAVAELTLARDSGLLLDSLCQGDAEFRLLQKNAPALMEDYQNRLAAHRLYDFHDLVLQLGMLLENTQVRELLRERFRYVHIDEVQDISDVEYDILTNLFPLATFLLCGDINQTIYEWRGSVPDRILPRFEQDFAALRVLLDVNYRSTPGLVNLGERFSCMALENKAPPPALFTKEEVVIGRFDNEEHQARRIYERIRGMDVQGDYSKIAVLCRSNAQCEALARAFAQFQEQSGDHSVRFLLAEEFRLFRAKEVKDILAFLHLLQNRAEETALARLAEGYFHIGAKTIRSVRALYPSTAIRLPDLIHPVTQQSGDYFSLLCEALRQGDVAVFDVESTGVDVHHDQIIQVAAVAIDSAGSVSASLMKYIRPSKSVGKSELVHHISDQYLAAHGEPPREVLDALSAFLSGKVVVGHNVGYDLAILEAELLRNGLPPLRVRGVYDTLDIARRYLPDAENHKLETLAELLQTPHKPSHDAMEDILATGDLLTELARQYIAAGNTERAAAYRKYLEAFAPIQQGLDALQQTAATCSVGDLCAHIVEQYHLREKYAAEPHRLENIGSFLSFMADPVFQSDSWRASLSLVLEYASLSSSELDRLSKTSRKLSIITIHQAKGCEFETVFVPNLLEYTFPNYGSIKNGSVREEARLFYVAITRAQKQLFLCYYQTDSKTGRAKTPSRFLDYCRR